LHRTTAASRGVVCAAASAIVGRAPASAPTTPGDSGEALADGAFCPAELPPEEPIAFGPPDEGPKDPGPEPSSPPDVVPPSAAEVTWPPHAVTDIAATAKRMARIIRTSYAVPARRAKAVLAPFIVRRAHAAALVMTKPAEQRNRGDRAGELGSEVFSGDQDLLADPLVRPCRVEVAQCVFSEDMPKVQL
jgi:hypothetical protein